MLIAGALDMKCDQLNFGLLNLSTESPSVSISDNNLKMIAGAADMMCDQLNFGLLNLASVSPESASLSLSVSENLAVSCSANLKTDTVAESTTRSFSPTSIRSGSHTDIGGRSLNEDQHIMIDDLSKLLGDAYKWGGLASSFYALFDGHGGCEAASYVKEYTMRLLFEGSDIPQAAPAGASISSDFFLKEVEEFHNKAFLQADQVLAEECNRYMKKDKTLIAEPDVRQMVLTDNDEFMIVACDGIWDVMSNQEAVALVRCQLRLHNDPQRCAKELVNQALRLHSTDNLTAIVVCFTSHTITPAAQTRFPNSRLFKKKPLNIAM
ncbi:hypothetical protein M8C21_021586 [Ambrosia artemisiifolia]|uniref:protein-serine/threonine phosphatase n=1 Tax=Ambrosia artemisiifolia TaxID=4212 RepID=A0AAD5C4T7_AMBAR|nr:hypothetical protein M8C21_021586 [Ambrosia artemisiifolia]